MKKPRLPVRWQYCLIWLGLVALVFIYSMGGYWDFLLLPDASHAPRPPVAAAPPSGADAARQLNNLLAPPSPLSPQARSASAADGPVRTGKAVVSNPRFITSGRDFTAHFDLGIPVERTRASWQVSPAAWMVDVPGQWRRQGREEYQIKHRLIRKARIMLYKDKLRLKFYFSNRQQKRGALPMVDFDATGISVTISDGGNPFN